MSMDSISNATGTLDQQLRQMRTADRVVPDAQVFTSPGAATIQYVEPAPPPPPRPGPPPARLPDISGGPGPTATGTASADSLSDSLAQRLTAARSVLLTLPTVTDTNATTPLPNPPPSGAVPARTLLTI
jgi:hypothetical protein